MKQSRLSTVTTIGVGSINFHHNPKLHQKQTASLY